MGNKPFNWNLLCLLSWCLFNGLWDSKDHSLCFKANILCSELTITTQKWINATVARKQSLREPMSAVKDHQNSSKDHILQTPALYFRNQIPSGLSPCTVSLSLHVFLDGRCAQRDFNERGIKQKKSCYTPPFFSSLYLFIHLFILCYLWKLFYTPLRLPPSPFLTF